MIHPSMTNEMFKGNKISLLYSRIYMIARNSTSPNIRVIGSYPVLFYHSFLLPTDIEKNRMEPQFMN
jgi:hypothetical protein